MVSGPPPATRLEQAVAKDKKADQLPTFATENVASLLKELHGMETDCKKPIKPGSPLSCNLTDCNDLVKRSQAMGGLMDSMLTSLRAM